MKSNIEAFVWALLFLTLYTPQYNAIKSHQTNCVIVCLCFWNQTSVGITTWFLLYLAKKKLNKREKKTRYQVTGTVWKKLQKSVLGVQNDTMTYEWMGKNKRKCYHKIKRSASLEEKKTLTQTYLFWYKYRRKE